MYARIFMLLAVALALAPNRLLAQATGPVVFFTDFDRGQVIRLDVGTMTSSVIFSNDNLELQDVRIGRDGKLCELGSA